jgi:hypothetical protein
MLKYAVIFLIISLVAGALGMSGISQLARPRFVGSFRAVLRDIPGARGVCLSGRRRNRSRGARDARMGGAGISDA